MCSARNPVRMNKRLISDHLSLAIDTQVATYGGRMQRRSALKSMILALGGGRLAWEDRRASGVVSPSSASPARASGSSMIETRDETRIHFRDWGAGPPIVFVAPSGM